MSRAPISVADREAEERAEHLIARFIEPYPGRPGPAEARLKIEEGGVPVWAIIGSLAEDAANIDAVARDYQVRREAVEAAWAYYHRHRAGIDSLIAATLL